VAGVQWSGWVVAFADGNERGDVGGLELGLLAKSAQGVTLPPGHVGRPLQDIGKRRSLVRKVTIRFIHLSGRPPFDPTARRPVFLDPFSGGVPSGASTYFVWIELLHPRLCEGRSGLIDAALAAQREDLAQEHVTRCDPPLVVIT
jgi:hypothetical protein